MKESEYTERLQKLLEAQQQNQPWGPLPLRKISALWGLSGTAPALHTLKKMVSRGDALSRECGKKHEYWAVGGVGGNNA